MDRGADVGVELRSLIFGDAFGEPGEEEDGKEGGGEAEQRESCEFSGLGRVFGAGPLMMMRSERGQARPRLVLTAVFFVAVSLAIRLSSFAKRESLPWRG